MQDNIEAVLSVMQFIYDHIMYAELNTKSDFCQECGFDGEIQIVEEDGKLVWECPHCGNRDQTKMNVARRTLVLSSGTRAVLRRLWIASFTCKFYWSFVNEQKSFTLLCSFYYLYQVTSKVYGSYPIKGYV